MDDNLRILVVGSTISIGVYFYDNSILDSNSKFIQGNFWFLNFNRIFFDPIFFRVIIDFDIPSS
jgi:hypothetical protein